MKLSDITNNLNKVFGITELTPVQQKMASLTARKAIQLVAPTGSGKTVAFALNTLLPLESSQRVPRVLVIVPSRELAKQVFETFRGAAGGALKTTVCYGGHQFSDEENSLHAGSDVVIGTPGRLLDHINRGTLEVAKIESLVLDEYDKSLELGFEGEMRRIVRRVPRKSRVLLTSATTLEAIPDFIDFSHPILVEPMADTGEPTPQGKLDIVKVVSYQRDKLDTAVNLLKSFGGEPTILFVNHRESAERVWQRLKKEGFDVSLYHGGLEQRDRENALEQFANQSATVMVATDLGSRGLDIDGVANVVHYNLPPTAESWTHRNGRTARMGADGAVYVIVGEDEAAPEYVAWNREWQPECDDARRPSRAPYATLLFSLGKREKISKGDIVGFLVANAGVSAGEIGRINVRDHTALAAVARSKARGAVQAANKAKIKNQRVKLTLLD